jgi:hypothetical protein
MTGIQLLGIDKDWAVSEYEQGRHAVVLHVRVVALLSDGAVTSAGGTTASMQALLMYGSANAAWVPCVYYGEHYEGATVANIGFIENTGTTDEIWYFLLPLPTTKGSLKLYVTGLRVDIQDADADDYVTAVYIYGMSYTGATEIDPTDYTTDRTAQGRYTYALADTDMSSYAEVMVRVSCVCTNAADLDIGAVCLLCFYST